MRAKGIDKPIVASLAGDVRGRGGGAVPVRARHPGLRLFDRDPGRGARREVPVGARCRPAVKRVCTAPSSRSLPPQASTRQRKREAPKGRRVDPAGAGARCSELLGDEPRQRDLLIEHLHKIQDRFGHLSAAHLAALAQEMRLAQTEVYEVATFYHHFDIVKEGDAAPPALTVRVCDGLSCEMAGARDLLARLPALLGTRRARDRRALHRPLRAGAGGGRRPEPGAARHAATAVAAAVDAGATRTSREGFIDLRGLPRATAATRCCANASPASATSRSVIKTLEDVGPARPRRRRLSGRAQVAHRARRAGAAADGRQHRRRRARHLQGPRLPRARSAPLPRRHADRRLGGRHRSRSTSTCATSTTAAARCSRPSSAKLQRRPADPRHARDRPAPRRRRLHLRRRVGDDRIDRRQARHAAPAPAVRRAGRPVRPADAGAQLRDAVLGARAAREGRRLVRLARPQRPQGPALVLGLGPRAASPASSWRRPASRSRS